MWMARWRSAQACQGFSRRPGLRTRRVIQVVVHVAELGIEIQPGGDAVEDPDLDLAERRLGNGRTRLLPAGSPGQRENGPRYRYRKSVDSPNRGGARGARGGRGHPQ